MQEDFGVAIRKAEKRINEAQIVNNEILHSYSSLHGNYLALKRSIKRKRQEPEGDGSHALGSVKRRRLSLKDTNTP